MNRPSRYSDTADYDHQFHAGNVGDVLKHVALGAWLAAFQQPDVAVRVVDTHAGAGMFKLPAQGEWTQGVGRIDGQPEAGMPPMVRSYLSAAGTRRTPGRGGLYPGSPAFERRQLRPQDRLVVCELAEAPRKKLEAHYADDPQVTVVGGDGLAALQALPPFDGVTVAFIDPPYVSKAEWQQVAEQVLAAKSAHPDLKVLIWYPIKSLMRPQALRAALRKGGLSGASFDLITTPLRLQKKRLNGSGLLLVEPPAGLLGALGQVAPWLGRALAPDGEWTVSTTEWSKS